MSLSIAINGLGRIGRNILRAWYERPVGDDLRIIHLNELADLATLAHLTRYDSTHGRFPENVKISGEDLIINGDRMTVSHAESISALPWRELGIDLVMECSGVYQTRQDGQEHLDRGARRVLFSNPATADVDATIVYGINHHLLRPEHRIISNASCTTNSIVPAIHCLDQALGIESGMTTTIHSMMNDQPLIDAYHHTDLRLTRSACQSVIPVETGLAKGIGRILPSMEGRFESQAMRVPTVNVSAIDMTVLVKQDTNAEEVNRILREASANFPPNVLDCTDEPLASCDFNHDPRSAIVDMGQTRVSGRRLVKILVWFDNEWAFANRMLDVAELIAKLD